ncbi:MAG: hypothetical protein R3185_09170, partial [Candidatus Thermoplasmatota archaeon]|nr:hypothetical protein [Candidatus Thermoplasmatota archaeon]
MALEAYQVLAWVALGAVLGITGQLARVIVGLRKVHGKLGPGRTFSDEFQPQRLIASLLLAVAVGGVAGVFAAMRLITPEGGGGTEAPEVITKSIIGVMIAAGYAGTDFIEGALDLDWGKKDGEKERGEAEDLPPAGKGEVTVSFSGAKDPTALTQRMGEALDLLETDEEGDVSVRLVLSSAPA